MSRRSVMKKIASHISSLVLLVGLGGSGILKAMPCADPGLLTSIPTSFSTSTAGTTVASYECLVQTSPGTEELVCFVITGGVGNSDNNVYRFEDETLTLVQANWNSYNFNYIDGESSNSTVVDIAPFKCNGQCYIAVSFFEGTSSNVVLTVYSVDSNGMLVSPIEPGVIENVVAFSLIVQAFECNGVCYVVTGRTENLRLYRFDPMGPGSLTLVQAITSYSIIEDLVAFECDSVWYVATAGDQANALYFIDPCNMSDPLTLADDSLDSLDQNIFIGKAVTAFLWNCKWYVTFAFSDEYNPLILTLKTYELLPGPQTLSEVDSIEIDKTATGTLTSYSCGCKCYVVLGSVSTSTNRVFEVQSDGTLLQIEIGFNTSQVVSLTPVDCCGCYVVSVGLDDALYRITSPQVVANDDCYFFETDSGEQTIAIFDNDCGCIDTSTVRFYADVDLTVPIGSMYGGTFSDALTPGGGSLTWNGTLVLYTPPSTMYDFLTDCFWYTIDDCCGCQDCAKVTVFVAEASSCDLIINSYSQVTNETCAGNDGSVEVVTNGGTPPFSYRITPDPNNQSTLYPIPQSAFTFTNLSAGNYLVGVTDALGCQAWQLFTIDLVNSITSVIPNSLSACITDAPSIVIGAPSTGNWSGPGITDLGYGSAEFNPGAAGPGLHTLTYNIGICTATIEACVNFCGEATLDVRSKEFPEVTCTITDACDGFGSIKIDVDSGEPPISIELSGTLFVMETLNSVPGSTTIPGLLPGPYFLSVTTYDGCVFEKNFEIGQPVSAICTVTSENCDGYPSGEIEVEVMLGTPPYTVDLSGPTPSMQVGAGPIFTFTGLASGSYTITVTDSNLCDATINCNVIGPLSIDPQGPLTICKLNTYGEPNIITLQGIAAGAYGIFGTWSTSGNPYGLSDLGNGNAEYNPTQDADDATVTLTYSLQGCEATIDITNVSTILIDSYPQGPFCCDDMTPVNLTASPVVYGGTWQIDPFTYAFVEDDAAGEATFTPSLAAPGIYSITYDSGAGCLGTLELEVLSCPELNVEVFCASCFDVDDGQIKVTASDGLSPYVVNLFNASNYLIATVDIQYSGDKHTFTGVDPQGSPYRVELTDANNCPAVSMVTVDEPADIVMPPSFSVVEDSPSVPLVALTNVGYCSELSAGGTWSGTGIENVNVAAGSADFNPSLVSPGMFTLRFTAASNTYDECFKEITATVECDGYLQLDVEAFCATCFDVDNGQIKVSASDGSSPYVVNLFNASNDLIATADIQYSGDMHTFTGLGAQGSPYRVELTDTDNCTESIDVIVGEPADIVLPPSFTIQESDYAMQLVAQTDVGYCSELSSGGTWSGPGIENVNVAAGSAQFNPALTGIGTFTLRFTAASGEYVECLSEITATVVSDVQFPELEIEGLARIVACRSKEFCFELIITNPNYSLDSGNVVVAGFLEPEWTVNQIADCTNGEQNYNGNPQGISTNPNQSSITVDRTAVNNTGQWNIGILEPNESICLKICGIDPNVGNKTLVISITQS